MPESRNIKSDARRIVDELPDDATWEDLMYEIYVRESIEAGLADVEAGRVVSHDDAVNSIRARIRERRDISVEPVTLDTLASISLARPASWARPAPWSAGSAITTWPSEAVESSLILTI